MRSRRLGGSASAPPAAPQPGARVGARKRWALLLALVVSAAGAVAFFSRSRPTDPEPSPPASTPEPAPLPPLSDSPYLNTKPGVAYIGDQKCLDCHADYKDYHAHPMGRSLFTVAGAPPLEKFETATPLAFRSGPLRFEVIREGNKQIHREWCEDARGQVVAEQRVEVNYSIGSGSQSRSYLYDQDGLLFESPITWYVLTNKWDLSPGYEKTNEHFTRAIESRCLFCHAGDARPVQNTNNRYRNPAFGQLAIGCERCHGPGSLHADRPATAPGEPDYTIVNPRRLAQDRRDSICEQCHLQGDSIIERRGRVQWDFRPGLALDDFVRVLVRPPEIEDPNRIVGHSEQMRQSACYTKSAGRFGCTSCHDPHRAPAAAGATAFYEAKCRDCHVPPGAAGAAGKIASPDCSLPPAGRGGKDCLACHMPRSASSTNPHLAVTDHRVLRRADQKRPVNSTFRRGDIPLLPFHNRGTAAGDPELARDLAMAAAELGSQMRRSGERTVGDFLFQRALPLLDTAAARDPGDVPALEARVLALFNQRRLDEALVAVDDVLAKAPDRESVLLIAGHTALVTGQLDRAERYTRRLTEKYAPVALYHEQLADILAKRGAWPEALAAARKAVARNPFRPEAREHLIAALLATGDLNGARAEFDAVGVIAPAHQAALRVRFPGRFDGPK